MLKIKRFLFSSFRIGNSITIAFPVFIWFLLPLIAVFAELFHHKINNYLVYKYVFIHVKELTNLYARYPDQYLDMNHYGPLFSLIIAPFALLPDSIGVILWVLFNAWFLYYAIKQLPLTVRSVHTILLIGAIQLMTASHNVQFNPIIAAWIILSFTMVKQGKDFWATLFIALGFLTKIYGIAGLLFFLFSENKLRFIASFIFWILILFCLPMLISSPSFIVHSYIDWKESLIEKNIQNMGLVGNMQDISVGGMIKRIFVIPDLSGFFVLIPAGLLFCLPLLRLRFYKNVVFQLYYLALTLISVVIFSSSAESPTYVIALCGVAIWFSLTMHSNNKWDNLLLAFVIILTTLSPTDLFPPYIRKHIISPFSLKALPCFIVWIMLIVKAAFAKDDSLKSPAITIL